MKPRAMRPVTTADAGRRVFCRTAAVTALSLAGVEAVAAATQGDNPAPGPAPQRSDEKPKRVKAVTARVISVKGECGLHKAGDSCTFTQAGVDGRICIHALYSMLPKVFAMMYGARFPWLQNPDLATHACPDPANPVVFEILRIYEG